MSPDDRYPYVGDSADGCRRSAQIDRKKAEGLDPVQDAQRIVELLDSAARWDAQATRIEAAWASSSR